MHIEAAPHVSPIRLWQSLCSGIQLARTDYEHVIHCAECERFATEMGNALEEIETALRTAGRDGGYDKAFPMTS